MKHAEDNTHKAGKKPRSVPFPTSIKEMRELGWDQADVILFTGDAFVDHPAFGIAIIARVLEHAGYRVAVIPQPNWRDDLRDFKKLGAPRLFFGVSSGNMDSMVNHYTANKRLRSNDAYTPGNKAGQRPDYAATVYSKILKSLYPEVPLVLGGVEASLRRLTHYDYWSDTLKPSILVDSGADLLVYGMGEQSILHIAGSLNDGEPIAALHDIPQTAYRTEDNPEGRIAPARVLASFEECLKDKQAFGRNFAAAETESNKIRQRHIIEQSGTCWVVVNPSYPPSTEEDMDAVYDLPYTHRPHPRYDGKEPIPAYVMIKASVTIHRGCFGGCSFCTISAHQGKSISSRSKESILRELNGIAADPAFKGHITDIGGPSANMYRMEGIDKAQCEPCARASCIYPQICENLQTDYQPLLELYRAARRIKGIKRITIGSGVRYDLLIDPKGRPAAPHALEYLTELIVHHVSGRLKVAPEHTSDRILTLLRKPSFEYFLQLQKRFSAICAEHGLKQQLIPYFISSLPASELEDMADLSNHMRALNIRLEQVQDLTPTPMTLASVHFYTGFDPYTKKPVHTARTPKEKKLQQLFFFLYDAEKRRELKRELTAIKRLDIIKQLGL